MRRLLSAALLGLLLAGCGDGGFDEVQGEDPTPDPGDLGDTTPAFKLGAVINGAFQEGVIHSTGDVVSATGLAQLRLNVIDTTTGRAFTGDAGPVRFFSICSLEDKAHFSPQETTFTNAVATTDFTNNGCEGATEIIATVTGTGGSEVTARKVLTLLPPQQVRAGSFDDTDLFVDRLLRVSPSAIQAGGSSQVEVVLLRADDSLYTGDADLAVSSNCLAADRATISPTAPALVGGRASFTYKANGCIGTDAIAVAVTVDGQTFQADGNITIASAPIAAVQFISAAPTTISLRGVGQPDSSIVAFKVIDTQGQPVAGARVVFSLQPDNGAATFSPTEAVTGADGNVSTIVRGGVVHTSVRVTASVGGGVQPGLSESLIIAGGIADQDSFSLSSDCSNVEGLEYDGTPVQLSIRAADRFNNPVPDGTAVAFITEGGSIQSGCFTASGTCGVTFVSQAPRPDDGRATIMAYAIGEESFFDINGNFAYDIGEEFHDLPEAFLDANENGVFDAGIERWIDFDGDGLFDDANGEFNGIACNESSCSVSNAVHVRASNVIVLSGSHATVGITPETIDLSSGDVAVTAVVGDQNGQPMPGGTTVVFESTLGTISGKTSFTQECTTFNAPIAYRINLTSPSGVTESQTGTLTVRVLTPKSIESVGTALVRVSPAAAPRDPTGDMREVQFISVAPSVIGVTGSPVTGVAEVVFRVLSTNGGTLPNVPVTFTLEPSVGGATLSPTTAESDADGLVKTRVTSGTIQTTLRVNASATYNGVTRSVLSDALTISTAIADQDSMSVSAETLNIEGHTLDGTTTTVTARLADRFNNPVPDNTAVSFRAEGGSIQPSCRTAAGACSVQFVTQNPRVVDHRVTIMAFATGEESFTDTNGNGRHDAGEPFTDIGEAFVDANENGVFDANESFIDFDVSSTYTGPSGSFTGLLCSGGCDTRTSLHVSDSVTLIMSSSNASISIIPAAITMSRATGPQSFFVVVTDTAGQPMPAGSTIAVESTYGAIVGQSAAVQPNTNVQGGTSFEFVLTPPEPEDGSPNNDLEPGLVTIRVTSPSGVETSSSATIN